MDSHNSQNTEQNDDPPQTNQEHTGITFSRSPPPVANTGLTRCCSTATTFKNQQSVVDILSTKIKHSIKFRKIETLANETSYSQSSAGPVKQSPQNLINKHGYKLCSLDSQHFLKTLILTTAPSHWTAPCSTPPALHYNIHILGCTDLLPHSLSKWLQQSIPTYTAKSRNPKLQIRYRPQNLQMIMFAKCAVIKLIQIKVMHEIWHILILHKP
jgi:hypothetical protein